MEYQFITQESAYYIQAIDLRIASFFNGFENATELINDMDENKSLQLVCVYEDKVIGTGRLTVENEVSSISQMAIVTEFQNRGIGKEILTQLIEKSKESKVFKILLSAREAAIPFYLKSGFDIIGGLYPSLKTGILHQKMILKYEN